MPGLIAHGALFCLSLAFLPLPRLNLPLCQQLPFDPKYTNEDSDTYYQYYTAIPIGWALAQSWNMGLLERIGSMICVEIDEFGVYLSGCKKCTRFESSA